MPLRNPAICSVGCVGAIGASGVVSLSWTQLCRQPINAHTHLKIYMVDYCFGASCSGYGKKKKESFGLKKCDL